MNDFRTRRLSMYLLVVILVLVGCGDENGTQGFTLGKTATLELSVGQTAIVPGDTIAVSSGNLLPGEEEARAAIRIVNTGQSDLAISELTLVSDPPGTFRLAADANSLGSLSSGPFTIVPQNAATGRASLIAHVIVTRPPRTIVPTGTIYVRSNSVASGISEPELVYKLSLETNPPKLVVVPGLLDLGEVPVGESRQATLAIDNRGGDLLTISRIILSGHDGFAVSFGPHNWTSAPASSELMVEPPIEIRPGQQAHAAVQFSASGPENAAAQLILYSNDPSAVQGNIVALIANAGTPTTPVVAIDAPNGASGEVTCRLVVEAIDTEPLTYSWHWQIGDDVAFSTFGPSLNAEQVKDCDRVRCWTEVMDGAGVVSSNLAEAILPLGADCDDQNVCTDMACGPQGGCMQSNNSSPCADTDLCNGTEECSGGQCAAGAYVTCLFVSDPCLESTCNPDTGLCDLTKPDDTPCADSDLCDGAEVCRAGRCTDGVVVGCLEVTDPCLERKCNPASGACDLAKSNGTQCEDDNLCNGTEVCQSGVCEAGQPVACDGVTSPCLEKACNPVTGACDLPRPDGIPCPDGNLCNGAEICESGACQAGEQTDCSDSKEPCLEKSCNPATGACDLPKPDNTSCASDDACDTLAACEAGECIGLMAMDCSGVVDPCTQQVCNPATGKCDLAVADGTPCDDTDGCTTGDFCQAGVCQPGSAVPATPECQCVDPTDLLLYYTFDGDVLDHSINGRNGTPSKAPSYSPAVRGSGMVFDGGTSISVASGKILGPTSSRNRTISFWLDTASTGGGMVVTQYENYQPANSSFFISYDRLRGTFDAAGNGTGSPGSLRAGVGSLSGWHHWVFVFASGSNGTAIYMDGVEKARGGVNMNGGESTLDTVIGQLPGVGGAYLSGTLDELRIHGRVLTPAEILAEFECAGTPPEPEPKPDVCATILLDGVQLHRSTVPGPIPDPMWVGIGTTSIGVQNAGSRIDELRIVDLAGGPPLLEDGFDDGSIWLRRSGSIGSADVVAGEGIVTADWGRFERSGSGVSAGSGFVLSFATYWSSTTNHYDMVVHRSNSTLPSWNNAWLRAAFDLARYGSSNGTPSATFSSEPRDASVVIGSSTPVASAPTIGWHTQSLRIEPGACVP